MRAVIDAVPLLIRSAGVKNYLYYWIEHLRRLAGADVIRTFPSMPVLGPLSHETSVAGPWRRFSGLATLAVANRTPLPILDWIARGADVFHTTNMVHHPPRRGGMVKNIRLTATIHDMTSYLMPELHARGNLLADRYYAEILRKADRLIAVSQCTKNDAVQALGIAPERICVIHSGVAEAFFHIDPAAVESVRTRYALKRPFVLALGTIEPRKNIDALLAAFDSLPQELRHEFELVLAGPMGWASAETAARVRSARYLGYVPESDIAPLTAAAAVFAYPSLYEGFGFPVAQAMAAGVPVVTSNVSSLPEIAGDAALLIEPRSLTELRDALARLLLSPDLRQQLAARGRTQALKFRWEDCAARSLRFFEEVAGE